MARRFAKPAWILAALAVAPGIAAIAFAAAPPAPSAPPASTYEPPKFNYGEGKIGLVEAVRLTLAHDPNLLLAAENVRFQQGVLQQLKGAFDWTLDSTLSYQYSVSPLRQSTIQSEKDRRTKIDQGRVTTCRDAANAHTEAGLLNQSLGGQTGVDYSQVDPDFGVELATLETLIQQSHDPNATAQLQQERTTTLQRRQQLFTATNLAQIDQSCAQITQDEQNIGGVPKDQETGTGNFQLQLSKLFRSGIEFTPSFTTGYSHSQFKGKRNGFTEPQLNPDGTPQTAEDGTPITRTIDFGGENIEDLYTSSIGFSINVPLLRGRGADDTGGQEKSAAVDLEASRLTLAHAASISAFNTTVAYWSLLAAQERVAVQQRAVDIETRLLELTDQLIEGDVLPRVERSRSLAGQASAQAQLEAARAALVSARLGLARSMGVDVDGQSNAPLAEGPFPTAPARDAVDTLDPPTLSTRALDLRADRRAARSLLVSGKILSEAARLEMRNRLDFAGNLSAGGQGEKSLSKAYDRMRGPNYSAGLTFEKAIGNNQSKGQYAQAQSQVRQREISAGDLDRNIRISVVTTLGSLAEAVTALDQAQEAAKHFQATIDGEFEKLKLGASTLIDAVLTEQQKTTADLGVLSAETQVAQLLAQLRFDTGTLVQETEGGGTVALESLTTLPRPAAGGGGLP